MGSKTSALRSPEDTHFSKTHIENCPETCENVEASSNDVNKKKENDDGPRQRQITIMIVGAGQRGQIYALYAKDFPDEMKVVGVAEPVMHRRSMMQKLYKIDEDHVFDDWKEAAALDRFADAVVIATLDDLHKEPAIAFANKGYHILLEKPMAQTLEDCKKIVAACKDNNIILAVGHVLRYTPRYRKVTEIIESGKIGEVVNIQHMEPVGWFHFAHSFVRGNWRSTKDSGCALLTKSCHDIDLINSFMSGSKCIAVSSFGSLSHFKKSDKPAGAGDRCLDCSIENDCPYSAVKMYLDSAKSGFPSYFCYVVTDEPTPKNIKEKLQTGPYGRCVYNCDNDVVSNQVVNMAFEGGKTVNFSMIAFTEKVCQRETKIFGTKGEMICNEGTPISVFDFATERREIFSPMQPTCHTSMSGHGFADFYLMQAFVKAVAHNDASMILSGPDDTLESHRLVFLAEQARLENRVIIISESQ